MKDNDRYITEFKLEPIIKYDKILSRFIVVSYELLALDSSKLKFDNAHYMFEHDIFALKHTKKIIENTSAEIHVNIELNSLLIGSKQISSLIVSGMVIEIVERLEGLSVEYAPLLKSFVKKVRKNNGKIAIDDCSMLDNEKELLELIKPEIIKVENKSDLTKLKPYLRKGIEIVAERIENQQHANIAYSMGASMLQGYWVSSCFKDK